MRGEGYTWSPQEDDLDGALDVKRDAGAGEWYEKEAKLIVSVT